MALTVEITSAARLDLVARALRSIGDKDLNRELYAGLNRVTKELRADAKEEAGRRLPHRGGLAEWASSASLSTRRLYGRNPGIQVVAKPRGRTVKAGSQLGLLDRGAVRHPVFGNRDVWVMQEVTPGWFTDPMEAGKDEVAKAIDDLLDDLANQVVRRLGLAA